MRRDHARQRDDLTLREARQIIGSLGYPSKMPGTAYGISAHLCKTGGILAKVKGSVCHGCYALKANYRYGSVQKAHANRLAGLANPAWSIAMAKVLNAVHRTKGRWKRRGRNGKFARGGRRWHRWHDSGDLQSLEHLAKICVVASLTPKIRHWLPTREFAIVRDYIRQGGTVPANLTIRVSATMVDGQATAHWPTTSGVHTDESHTPANTHICPAPTQQGKCGPCRACWSPTVEHVSYRLH